MIIQNLENEDEARNRLFRILPSVNDLLLTPECQTLLETYPREAVLFAARKALAELRIEVSSGQHAETSLQESIKNVPEFMAEQLALEKRYSLRPVINATGVVLHTNLGRAPLSSSALRHLVEVAQGYCNLELDLETGLRSRRDVRSEEHTSELQ